MANVTPTRNDAGKALFRQRHPTLSWSHQDAWIKEHYRVLAETPDHISPSSDPPNSTPQGQQRS